jgi:hypothetical protein
MTLSDLAGGTEDAELMCARCFRVLSPDDVVAADGAGIAHVDCRRPRDLTREERSLLYGYCWAHPIDCPACGQSFRLFELDSDPFDSYKRTCCARCRVDLIENVRDHLYTCPLSPEVVRRRVRETHETARRLVTQARELGDRADGLMREAEVAANELCDALKQSTSEALRRLIQAKLRDGSLPHDNIPATILRSPGDGSACGVCDQPLATHQVMRLMPCGTTLIRLHTDCFEVWNEERYRFKSSDARDGADPRQHP